MCIALIAVIASVSGLNVAQQALAADLGADQGKLLWIINGYTLALAACSRLFIGRSLTDFPLIITTSYAWRRSSISPKEKMCCA